jgi:hypothetical protein
MIEASCHCGAVRIAVPHLPPKLTDCNCSLCRRVAGLWAYYSPAEVRVVGETVPYVQGDRMLETRHCPTCGCVTHWSPTERADANRMGVNARLMDPAVIAAIPVRRLDGADTWTYLD